MIRALLFLFLAFSLFAEECCEPKKSLWDFHPWHVGGNAIAFGKADVDLKNGPHDGNVIFNKANLYTYFFLPINECNFFLPRIEWNAFTLDWNHNPRFHETHFQFIQFALTFLSVGLERWKWIARADYNIDLKHFSRARQYGLFSALLWGTHQIHRKWHYHVGAFGYGGLEGSEIYPIIGVDFAPNKKWFFQLVFPISYAIEYNINERWRIAVKGRPLKERFRVGKNEPSPRSVFSYSTFGAEFNVHYERFLRLELEFFGGYNFGGSLYFKNRHGHNALYTNVKGSPYAGASLNWGI